jgi:hypothetical protein
MFDGATGLDTIDLSGNVLTRIDERSFSLLPRLRTIDLSNNRLHTLKVHLFADIPTLNLLHLHGNPWTCDCHLRELVRVLGASHQARVSPQPVQVQYVKQYHLSPPATCFLPVKVRDKQWDQLNLDEFACAPEARHFEIQRVGEIY